jgi:hypothetical protein
MSGVCIAGSEIHTDNDRLPGGGPQFRQVREFSELFFFPRKSAPQ